MHTIIIIFFIFIIAIIISYHFVGSSTVTIDITLKTATIWIQIQNVLKKYHKGKSVNLLV